MKIVEYTDKDVSEFLEESNKIEGVYGGDALRQALEAWKSLTKLKEMSVGAILKAHKILMLNQPLAPDEKGYLRKIPVYIGGKEAMKPERISDNLIQLVINVNDVVHNGKREPATFLDPLIRSHHVQYEYIHPFVDGNGRTGRMLMNWQRMQARLPILIIHEGEEQQLYYDWFKIPAETSTP